MDQDPLVRDQIEAGEAFLRDFGDDVSIAAAFWLKLPDAADWYLYVASDEITDENIREMYMASSRRLRARKGPWLDPFRINLINASHPLAQAVIEFRDTYHLSIPTWYNGTFLGGMGIDGAYIYPSIAMPKSVP